METLFNWRRCLKTAKKCHFDTSVSFSTLLTKIGQSSHVWVCLIWHLKWHFLVVLGTYASFEQFLLKNNKISSEKNTVIKTRIINVLLKQQDSVTSVGSGIHVRKTKTVQEGSAKVSVQASKTRSPDTIGSRLVWAYIKAINSRLIFRGRSSSVDPWTDSEKTQIVEDCPDHDCSCFNDEDDAKFSLWNLNIQGLTYNIFTFRSQTQLRFLSYKC